MTGRAVDTALAVTGRGAGAAEAGRSRYQVLSGRDQRSRAGSRGWRDCGMGRRESRWAPGKVVRPARLVPTALVQMRP
jgi:hypothetical protein